MEGEKIVDNYLYSGEISDLPSYFRLPSLDKLDHPVIFKLMNMNDSRNYLLKKIADYIEKNLDPVD